MEMLPERTAACSSVGASGCIVLCRLSMSSPRLAQLTAPTHIACREQDSSSRKEHNCRHRCASMLARTHRVSALYT